MPYQKWVRKGRRKPVFTQEESTITVDLGREHIERMLAHREPFLLVDGVDAVDLQEETIRGYRHIDAQDPVFKGHFPGYPVYPGTLQMEMIGQLGICLHHLLQSGKTTTEPGETPQNLRLLKLHHAVFLAEVSPGDNLTLLGKILEQDSYTVTCIGQVYKQETICAFGIMEVYLLDDQE